MVLVRTPETDSLPKMPNRPLVPISQRSEDPALLPRKATAPPLKPHHRGPPSTARMFEALPQSVVVVLTELRHLMWCALSPAQIKRSNHALSAFWTVWIRLRNCACDCPLSANHFCTNALWPMGIPNTTNPRSSSGPSPVHASVPMVSKSSCLMLALFQTLVFRRLTWMPTDLKSDSLSWRKISATREGSQRT